MTGHRAYLDYNASAPLLPEARTAMLAALDVSANPSSVHGEGRTARRIVEDARRDVAALVNSKPDHVVFTSGATEAASTLLTPDWRMGRGDCPHVAALCFGGRSSLPAERRTFPGEQRGAHRRRSEWRVRSRRAGAALAEHDRSEGPAARRDPSRQQRDRRHPAGARNRQDREGCRRRAGARRRAGGGPHSARHLRRLGGLPDPVLAQDRRSDRASARSSRHPT